jgi:hypothetical protein
MTIEIYHPEHPNLPYGLIERWGGEIDGHHTWVIFLKEYSSPYPVWGTMEDALEVFILRANLTQEQVESLTTRELPGVVPF